MQEVLSKIIAWAFANGIEISVRCHRDPGIKDQIEIDLKKNGASELIRIYDWDELDRKALKNIIEAKASNLSMTRLFL